LNQIPVIDNQTAWEQTASTLSNETILCIDTESNSLHAFRECICLIQIGTRTESFLLDPLVVKDLSSLGKIMADANVNKVLHGSDYDLRCFYRDYGFNLNNLFDTETAARFLGSRSPNLASVLETFLKVVIPKSQKLQRSNWALRPLTPEAITYAAGDVQHLVALAEALRQRLTTLGRLDWVLEECQRMEEPRYQAPDPPETAFLKVKGSHHLMPRELTILREIYLFRELEAEKRNCPPFRIMSSETMLYLSQSPNSQVGEVPGLSPRLVQRRGDELRMALERGASGPEFRRPARSSRENPWTPATRERLATLKQWRNARGESLDLDPALLWPARSLERLALKTDGWVAELHEDSHGRVRAWQRREFSGDLEQLLEVA